MIDNDYHNFTMLVQGKLFPETFNYIEKYKQLGFKICLSSYEPVDLNIDQIVINDINKAEKLFSSKTGTTSSGKFQIYSTFNGLQQIKTKYVIKIRTDEFYTLDKILETFLYNDNKIIFHNLFYRPPKPQWGYYHISDKLLVGKTENLLMMFSVAYDIVNCNRNIIYAPRCIEDLLGYSFLLYRSDFNEELCFKNRDDLINSYYDFVNFTELNPFEMKFNSVTNMIYTENTIDPDYHRLWVDVTRDLADIFWKK